MAAIFCKLLQRKTYDIVSHKHYFIILLLSLIALSFAAFHFGEASLEWSQSKYRALFSRYKDNIAKSSLENLLCQHSPIDVVYTWVNGSDPGHLEQLTRTITQLHLVDDSSYTACSLSNCIRSHLVLVRPAVTDLELLRQSLGSPFHIHKLASTWVHNTTFLTFSSPEHAEAALNKTSTTHNRTLHPAFITDTPHFLHTEPLPTVLLGLDVPQNCSAQDLLASLPQHLQGICQKVYLQTEDAGHTVAVVILREAHNATTFALKKTQVRLVPAHLVIFPATGNENVAPSRFADNEELKFSLRSLEKFAPWVRRIYIVTDGQIPSWLNLDHPRLFIVTHEDIFPNASHLPTFSSPAIESHLHRIPGLSKKFLYLNDDVLFGSPVFPEDFYTSHRGFKVRLSWPVPPCSEGCPASWISDHFCDQACNNSQCHWDGGDCAQSSNPLAVAGHGLFQMRPGPVNLHAALLNTADVCSSNCPTSWLNDHYCDQSCNILECAFDLGDCGTANYNYLPHWDLLPNKTSYLIPPDTPGMYFNLTQLLANDNITLSKGRYDGSHPAVRTMAINLKLKILIVLLRPGKLDRLPFSLLLKTAPHLNGTDLEFVLEANKTTLSSHNPSIHITSSPQKLLKSPFSLTKNLPAGIGSLNHSMADLPIEKQQKIIQLILLQDQATGPEALAMKIAEVIQDQESQPDIVSMTTAKAVARSVTSGRLGRRHLLDTFGDSLRHVNRLFDKSFGLEPRKVPAHIAHLVDVDIEQRLQDRFPEEFEATSSHQIRTGGDMQFAFSYFYFLMDEKRNLSLDEIFSIFDLDESGDWSEGEVHSLWTRMFDIPLDETAVKEMEDVLVNCSASATKDESPRRMTLPVLQLCTVLTEKLLTHFGRVHTNKFEVLGEEDVTFVMVPNNQLQAALALDKVLKYPRKFICINDNLDHGSGEATRIQEMIRFIYETILPRQSQFELDPDYQNLFLTVRELRSWQRFRDGVRVALYLSIVLLLFLSVLAFLATERPRGSSRRESSLLPHFWN